MPWTWAFEMSLLSHLEGVWHQDKSLVNPEIIIKQRNSLFYILFLRVKHFPISQHWLEPWILSKCSTCKDIWEPRDLVAFQKMIDFTWIFTNGKPQLPHSCKEAAVTPGTPYEKTLFGALLGLPIIWKFIVLLKVVKKILSPPPLFRHRIAWDNQLHLFGSCSSCFPLIYKLHVFLLIFPSNSSVSTS